MYLTNSLYRNVSNNRNIHNNTLSEEKKQSILVYKINFTKCAERNYSEGDIIYIGKDRKSAIDKRTQSMIIDTNSFFETETKTFFSLNKEEKLQKENSKDLYFYYLDYNENIIVTSVIKLFLNENKEIVITSIYNDSRTIDEERLIKALKNFFTNIATRIVIRSENEKTRTDFIFTHFSLRKINETEFEYVRDICMDDNFFSFFDINSKIISSVQNVKTRLIEYDKNINESQQKMLSIQNLLKDKNKDLITVGFIDSSDNPNFSVFKPSYKIEIKDMCMMKSDRDNFIITDKINLRNVFEAVILKNFLTRFNFYINPSDPQVIKLNRNFVIFGFLLNELSLYEEFSNSFQNLNELVNILKQDNNFSFLYNMLWKMIDLKEETKFDIISIYK